MSSMSIKQIIRELMVSYGLTYESFAEVLGVSKTTVYHAVAGRQKSMSVDKAVEVLGVLGYCLVVCPASGGLPDGAVVVAQRSESEVHLD